MRTENITLEILRSLAVQIPVLLVCLVALVVIFIRRGDSRSASVWALAGFALVLLVCFGSAVAQPLVRNWAMRNGGTSGVAAAFTGMAIFWSALRAISYGLLLSAVFAGRSPQLPKRA